MYCNAKELYSAKMRVFGKENFSDNAIRMHRAISWLFACENGENVDLSFLSAWIGFNACYSVPPENAGETENARMWKFLQDVIEQDEQRLIASYVFDEQIGLIDILMSNQYLFKQFWISVHIQEEGWDDEYEIQYARMLVDRDQRNALSHCNAIIQRVYVLRNQVIHGGATYESSLNREQMKICNQFIHGLLLRIINVMIRKPNHDWGSTNYPPLTGM
jgi:hypothetical protein